MGLPGELVLGQLDVVLARLDATEIAGAVGGPFLSLRTVDGDDPAGRVRVFSSARVPRIVYSSIDLPARAMETHMFYAFTPGRSAVPHLTLDAVATRGILAFHVDLVPRVDLATHVEYMDAVFRPLDEPHAVVAGDVAFTPASVPPRGRALMSPWMLANRASAEAFGTARGPIEAYVEHWLGLVEAGLPSDVVDAVADTDLVERDAALRRSLFGLDVDPAWEHVAAIVGPEPVATLRAQMLGR